MGLFDKIKKAIDDSGVVDAAKSAVMNTIANKTSAQPEKKIEEAPAPKEVKPKAPPKPACEHGECVICSNVEGKRLFFTCPDSAKCEKKEKYAAGDLWDKDLLPIVRAYTALQNYRGGWDAHEAAKRKLANAMINTYVPALKKFDFTTFVSERVEYSGIGKSNSLLNLFVNFKRRNFEFKEDKKDTYIEVIKAADSEYHYTINLDEAELLYNPSLYENEDAVYVAKAFMRLSNKKWVSSHLLDTSVIDFKEFYNEDGTIKAAGTDCREGDTIYNIVEKWCNGNENLEQFEKEKKEREEEKRAKEAKERAEKLQQALATGDFRNL